ncbi:MAG: CoA transferase, partial [Chloroflexi bacterium]|nr:CoA transferase [Chloroflexota bacterium]
VVTALMGGTVAQAGKGNPPVIHFTSDLGAGVTTATAMLMALYQRDRTGKGQRIESRMLSAAAYLHSDDFIRYAGMPTRRIADKGQHGLNALYRLYPASEGWVFLAAPLESEWEAFCKATGKAEWLRDDRFRTLEARAANDEALIALLAGLFKTKPATDWERLLTPLDVACVVAHEDFGAMLFQNDNMREAVGHLTGTHPTFGEFTQAGPLVRLASVPTVSRLQSFTSGQNTADVLRSLGFPTENMPMPRQEAVSG